MTKIKPIENLILVALLTLLTISFVPLYADLIEDIGDLEELEQTKKPKGEGEGSKASDPAVRPEKPKKAGAKKPQKGASANTKTKPKGGVKRVSPKAPSPPKALGIKGQSQKGAKKKPALQRDRKEPIYFSCKGKSTLLKLEGIVSLEDDVVITQGQLRFRADKAKIFFIDKDIEGDIDYAEFHGKVHVLKNSPIPKEKVTANGDRAFYYSLKQRIDLIGHARLLKGGHLIKGEKINYHLDTKMITVDQAQGVVQPQTKNNK